MRDFVFLCQERNNIIPILADANRPETYKDRIPKEYDVIFQDIAQRSQVSIFLKNLKMFLKKGGFVEITLNRRGNDGEQTLSIQIPPDTDKTPWCRIPNLGKPGKNWGSTGDLYIIFQP